MRILNNEINLRCAAERQINTEKLAHLYFIYPKSLNYHL